MVQFIASKSFNYGNFSLSGMFGAGTTATADNFLSIGGTRYFHTFVYDNASGQDFAASGASTLQMTGFGYLRGPVNALSAGLHDDAAGLFRSDWTLKGLALDGATLAQVAASATRADDANLLKTIFAGNDTISLSRDNDIVSGFAGDDRIYGGAGNDSLGGDTGNDLLNGGTGADRLFGGAGKDYFDFNAISESTVAVAGRDTIFDFVRGSDKIDLTGVDANVRVGGDQQFVYHLASAHHGYDVWYVKSGTDVVVYADVDGLAGADFSILVKNVSALSASDFLL